MTEAKATNTENEGSTTPSTPPFSEESNAGENLQNRILELESQASEKDKKYVYLYAEFENFKKRSSKERSDLLKFGCESMCRDLLSTVDNLERALSHTSPDTDKTLIDGLKMVLSEFKNTLKRQGVESVETLKSDFDPNLHEAVGQEVSDLPAGTILKEHTRGYTLHGRLLRPARVVVSMGQTGNVTESAESSLS